MVLDNAYWCQLFSDFILAEEQESQSGHMLLPIVSTFQGKKMGIIFFPSQSLNLFLGYICLFVWQRLSFEDLNNNSMSLLEETDTCFDVKWDNLHSKQVDIKAAANLPGLLLGIYQEENKYEDRFRFFSVDLLQCWLQPEGPFPLALMAFQSGSRVLFYMFNDPVVHHEI